MNQELEQLLQTDHRIWRGRSSCADLPVIATGFSELDPLLPGGGWPARSLIEIGAAAWGIGELRLLLPAMRLLNQGGGWQVWIKPPFEPYAPALVRHGLDLRRMLVVDSGVDDNDCWWTMEKFLRHPAANLVMAWPHRLKMGALRRLQLAAEEGGTMGVLFHRQETVGGTPAALRIVLQPVVEGIEVRILKARGGFGGAVARLALE